MGYVPKSDDDYPTGRTARWRSGTWTLPNRVRALSERQMWKQFHTLSDAHEIDTARLAKMNSNRFP